MTFIVLWKDGKQKFVFIFVIRLSEINKYLSQNFSYLALEKGVQFTSGTNQFFVIS